MKLKVQGITTLLEQTQFERRQKITGKKKSELRAQLRALVNVTEQMKYKIIKIPKSRVK